MRSSPAVAAFRKASKDGASCAVADPRSPERGSSLAILGRMTTTSSGRGEADRGRAPAAFVQGSRPDVLLRVALWILTAIVVGVAAKDLLTGYPVAVDIQIPLRAADSLAGGRPALPRVELRGTGRAGPAVPVPAVRAPVDRAVDRPARDRWSSAAWSPSLSGSRSGPVGAWRSRGSGRRPSCSGRRSSRRSSAATSRSSCSRRSSRCCSAASPGAGRPVPARRTALDGDRPARLAGRRAGVANGASSRLRPSPGSCSFVAARGPPWPARSSSARSLLVTLPLTGLGPGSTGWPSSGAPRIRPGSMAGPGSPTACPAIVGLGSRSRRRWPRTFVPGPVRAPPGSGS